MALPKILKRIDQRLATIEANLAAIMRGVDSDRGVTQWEEDDVEELTVDHLMRVEGVTPEIANGILQLISEPDLAGQSPKWDIDANKIAPTGDDSSDTPSDDPPTDDDAGEDSDDDADKDAKPKRGRKAKAE